MIGLFAPEVTPYIAIDGKMRREWVTESDADRVQALWHKNMVSTTSLWRSKDVVQDVVQAFEATRTNRILHPSLAPA